MNPTAPAQKLTGFGPCVTTAHSRNFNQSSHCFFHSFMLLSEYIIFNICSVSLTLSIELSIYLSIYPTIYQSIYLSIYLYLYTYLHVSVCAVPILSKACAPKSDGDQLRPVAAK